MNSQQIAQSLSFIRPNAEWVLRENEIEWLDTKQTQPTDSEIEAGWLAFESKLETDKQEAKERKAAAEAKLAALGLNEDDLKALGL